jgi:hypothetical protein
MRISSDLFPFVSHDKYGYDLDYAAADIDARCRGRRRGQTVTSHRPPAILPTYAAIG